MLNSIYIIDIKIMAKINLKLHFWRERFKILYAMLVWTAASLHTVTKPPVVYQF